MRDTRPTQLPPGVGIGLVVGQPSPAAAGLPGGTGSEGRWGAWRPGSQQYPPLQTRLPWGPSNLGPWQATDSP